MSKNTFQVFTRGGGSWWRSCWVAALAILVALLPSYLAVLLHVPGEHGEVFLVIAIAAAGWYGGYRSAVLAVLLGMLMLGGLAIWDLPPAGLLVFFLSGLIAGSFAAAVRNKSQADRDALLGQRLERIIDASPVGLLVVNREGQIVHVNTAIESMFGFEPQVLLGSPVEELLPARHRDAHPGYRADFYRNPAVRSMGRGRALSGLRKDGTEFPLEIGLNPIELGGEVHVLASVLSMEERQRYEQAVHASEERFRALVESLPQMIWTCLPDGSCDYLSPQWIEYTGVPEGGHLGFEWAEAIHPEDRERLLSTWKEAAGVSDRFESEFRIRNHAGAFRWFKSRGQRYTAMDGTMKWFGVCTDMQEQREAQDAIQSLNVALERRVEDRTQALIKSNDSLVTEIEQRQQTEADLRASERRFRWFVESIKDHAVFMLDTDGCVASWNAGAERIKGYAAEEIIGSHFSRFYPADVAASGKLEAILEEAANTGRRDTSGWRIRKDGSRFWAHVSIAAIRGEKGELLGYSKLTRDGTEARAAEQALAASEGLLRQFVKHCPAAVAMFDTDMCYLRVSDRWLSDFHLEEEQIIGRSHYEIFPDLPERWKEMHQRVLAGAVESCDEEFFERADGSCEWIQWECQPWRETPEQVGGLILFNQIITERKRTESKLREQENRFRGAFYNAPIGMALVALDGGWLRVNRSICEILGYTEEELLETDFGSLTHPDDLQVDLENLGRTISGEIASYQIEKRYLHKQGHEIPSILSVSLIRDADGDPLYFTSQVIDISERKRYERQLESSLAENQLLLKEIHHRVKNNLQVVCTLLDLQSEFTSEEAVKDMFRDSQGRVRSMALIHERLYRTADFTEVDLSDYVEQLAEGLYRAYNCSPGNVVLELDVDHKALPLDTAIPCGLLLNELMSNSMKHAFSGGQRGTLRVELKFDGNTGLLAISDTGPGIPDGVDILDSPSFGLQLVHTLVSQIRGTIECESKNGTTFRIRFQVDR